MKTSRIYKALYRFCRDNPWLAGIWVRIKGNHVHIDGCEFSVDVPNVSYGFKGEFLLDRYENAERRLIQEYLVPRLPVIELGGGIGVTSCIINKQLKQSEDHIVIEANTSLIPVLEKNRNMNKCAFQVRNLAYSFDSDEERFQARCMYTVGSVSKLQASTEEANEIVVPAVPLRKLLYETGFSQVTLVCDIEGSEFELIENEIDVISTHVHTFLVEFHSHFAVNRDLEWYHNHLQENGLRFIEQYGKVCLFQNERLS